MKALIQRVRDAAVDVDGQAVGKIGHGLLVYVGISGEDGPANAEKLAQRVAGLRMFPDAQDKLNLSVLEVGGEVLAISNFTLMADTASGRRPSFTGAARGEQALPLFQAFVAHLRALGCRVETGRFGAKMIISSTAEGPVNLILDA